MRLGNLSQLAAVFCAWLLAAAHAEAAPGDLANAAYQGDSAKVASMLAKGADPNDRGQQQATALMFAAQNNKLDMVKALLERGADPNATRGNGVTALHHGAATGRPDVLAALLEAGAELEAKTATGATPLRTALSSQNWTAAEFLFERGAVLSNAKDYQQALYWALPFSPTKPDKPGAVKIPVYTPEVLSRALIDKLIADGADPAQTPGGVQTLLYAAASQLQYEAIPFLLELGAKVDEPSWSGDTPLLLTTGKAQIEENLDVVAFSQTVISSAAIDARTSLRAMMSAPADNAGVLMFEIDNAWPRLKVVSERRSATIKVLLAAGADANLASKKGETPASRLAKSYDGPSMAALMAGGADATLRDGSRAVALHTAAAGGYFEVVEQMLKGGANVNARNAKDETALIAAATGGGDLRTVGLLLEAGADVNARDALGLTALHHAAGAQETYQTKETKSNPQLAPVLRQLLQAGADPLIRDNSGKTARDYANGPKYGDGARILKSAEDAARKRN